MSRLALLPPMLHLIRAVRLASENAPEAPALADISSATEEYVAECLSSPDVSNLITSLDEELQAVHEDVVDYSSPAQLEVFLVVLSHIQPFLSPTSVIHWWDMVLRPALQESKLRALAINNAKEVVIGTLKKTEEKFIAAIRDFRRRLFDLYLLDTHDKGSGDVPEYAELNIDRRLYLKVNLEDILLQFGNEAPQEFMTEVQDLFAIPTLRLQLFMLLNIYSSSSSFAVSAAIMAKHPLMERLMLSIVLDNSSTACSVALTVLLKMLPILAANARDELRVLLPMLMAILARLMCWKERHPANADVPSDEAPDADLERELEVEINPVLRPDPKWNWDRLEMAFDATASKPPLSRPYFTTLYYLYPANILKFLHSPVKYLRDCGLSSPWVESWEQALDQVEIRVQSEHLLRDHICHSALIWQNATSEMEEPEFWSQFTVARIITEAILLDVRNHTLNVTERQAELADARVKPSASHSADRESDLGELPDKNALGDVSSSKASMPLQEMIHTSFTLKSNINFDKSIPDRPQSVFTPSPMPPPRGSVRSPSPLESKDQNVPSYMLPAVTSLQREALLLRNELNFEIWLSRENIKHIGRLYQDRCLVKSAEAERQGLYNKLRKYRGQVVRLEGELHEHKVQASSTKNKYAEWNSELQKKLKELREEKKSWMVEAASLRRTQNDNKTLLEAQERLLTEANRKRFELETWRKESQHKIDRLHDYERQLDQHFKMQQLWDEDFARFNERGEQIMIMQSHFKQMELRLESYEKTQSEMDAQIRAYRRQIQTLEARLSQMRRKTDSLRHPLEQEIASAAGERGALTKANQKLRDENDRLKSDNDELRAVVEVHLEGR